MGLLALTHYGGLEEEGDKYIFHTRTPMCRPDDFLQLFSFCCVLVFNLFSTMTHFHIQSGYWAVLYSFRDLCRD